MTPHLNFLLTRDLRKSDLALHTSISGGSAVHKLIRAAPYPLFPSHRHPFQSNYSPQRVILPMLDGVQGFCGTPRLRWG